MRSFVPAIIAAVCLSLSLALFLYRRARDRRPPEPAPGQQAAPPAPDLTTTPV